MGNFDAVKGSDGRTQLRFLGPPIVEYNGERVPGLESRKPLAFLGYLAAHDTPIPRSQLAELFWEGQSEDRSRSNLRQMLHRLAVGLPHCLKIERQTVEFVHLPAMSVDLHDFKTFLARGDVASMDQAAALYRGEFMTGLFLDACTEFEAWLVMEREHWQQRVTQVLSTLVARTTEQRDWESSLRFADRLLALDPWQEDAHRQKMTMLSRMGQRTAALQQFKSLQQSLADTFGIPPAPETLTVYERIKAQVDGMAANIQAPSTFTSSSLSVTPTSTPILPGLDVVRANDLAGIPRESTFIGRQHEMTQLAAWHVGGHSPLIAILGMGGEGKSALAVHYARSLLEPPGAHAPVDRVLWVSLLNAPACATVLRMWLRALSDQHLAVLPDTADELLAFLFRCLRDQRCLLVLDNFESLMADDGSFRANYEDYGLLLQAMTERTHESCLLLTSRTLPTRLTRQAHAHSRIQVLPLSGLPILDGTELLAQAGMAGGRAELARRYSGNPLALKLVADTVRTLFESDVDAFLAHGTLVFGDIQAVLDEQIGRLSALERELLTALAVAREPISVSLLLEGMATPVDRSRLLQAVHTLQHSSLIETSQGGVLALQNVITEYLTDRLLQNITADLATDQLDRFGQHPLINARAYEHVQDSQRRLLLGPIAGWAVERWGRQGAIGRLEKWVEQLRTGDAQMGGYAAANLLHLLVHAQANLSGLNFSQLNIRQADLRTPLLSGVNFAGAVFRDCAFTNTLGAVSTLAVSPDGCWLATGGSDGDIFLWHMPNFELHATLRHHSNFVSALSFSRDSQTLASSDYDGQICLWDIPNGQLTRVLTNRGAWITAISLYRNGDALAIVEPDNAIRLWDWRRETLLHTLITPAIVIDLAISPDEQTLVGVGNDGDINVWHLETGEKRYQVRGHDGKILAVAFCPQGDHFATGGESGDVCIWHASTGDLDCRFQAHGDAVLAVAYAQDGKTLSSSGADGTIRLWDVDTNRPQRTLVGHRGWVKAIAFTVGGRALVSGGYDQTVRLWDAQDGQVQHVVRGHLRWVNFLKFSHDGRRLASASLDGAVRIWDTASGRMVHALNGPQAATRCLAFSPDDARFASVGDDRFVRVWDAHSGELLRTLSGHTASVRTVNFSPDGQLLTSGSNDRSIRVWDARSGHLQRIIPETSATLPHSAGFMPCRPHLAFGTYRNTVEIVDSNLGKTLLTFDTGTATPSVVTVDSACRLVACGTHTGDIFVWDIATPSASLRFRLSPTAVISPIWRMLFSPDRTKLVWVNASLEINLLDLKHGQASEPIPTHFGAFCVAFSSDGQRLITDGPDHTVQIRDAASGEIQRTLHGHTASVTSIEVNSPEDTTADDMIASSSADGTIRVWDGKTGRCLHVLEPEGPYAGMNITGAIGITTAQRKTLIALGAVDGVTANK